jgi:hypothetical protein
VLGCQFGTMASVFFAMYFDALCLPSRAVVTDWRDR